MARKRFSVPAYIYLVPVLFLFAVGVLFRSAFTASANACGCDPTQISGRIDPVGTSGDFQGKRVIVPPEILSIEKTSPVLGVATPNERWIDVDLSEQKLRAWDGSNLFLETPISTGLPGFDTPTGEFHIWMKIRATRMSGGEGRYAYDLPNVPYVMFFSNDKVSAYKGYGLHGTYWHNDFGKVHSHGCVNLPTPVAKILYEWTTPTLDIGQTMLRVSGEDLGSRIVIHD